MSDPTLEVLAQRVARLERQNRVLKLGAIAIVAVVAAALWIGAATKSQTVEAERFVVRDGRGTVRGELTGAQLSFFDQKHLPVAVMGSWRLGGKLSLSEISGEGKTLIRRGEFTGTDLSFFNQDDVRMVSLNATEVSGNLWLNSTTWGKWMVQPSDGLIVVDSKGMQRGLLRASDDVWLALSDSHGMTRARISVGPGKDTTIVLNDGEERPRARLQVTEQGPSLVFLDADGEAVWSAP